MILILKDHPDPNQLENLENWLTSMGLTLHESQGENHLILGLVGDTSAVDIDLVKALDIVQDVRRIQEPYKKANRKFHPLPTVSSVGDVQVGGGAFAVFAGPGAVESEEQIHRLAGLVKQAGADVLTAGAFLSRTSPYAFSGLGVSALRQLSAAGKAAGIATASELTDLRTLDAFEEIDGVILGPGNMTNTALLKALGATNKCVILCRGLSSTVEEWLMSAEYLLSGGNENVVLCDQGVRGFDSACRLAADLSSVPLAHMLTHLPVMYAPSMATGRQELAAPLGLAAAAAGADGVWLTCHDDPEHALFAGGESLTPAALSTLVQDMRRVRKAGEA